MALTRHSHGRQVWTSFCAGARLYFERWTSTARNFVAPFSLFWISLHKKGHARDSSDALSNQGRWWLVILCYVVQLVLSDHLAGRDHTLRVHATRCGPFACKRLVIKSLLGSLDNYGCRHPDLVGVVMGSLENCKLSS